MIPTNCVAGAHSADACKVNFMNMFVCVCPNGLVCLGGKVQYFISTGVSPCFPAYHAQLNRDGAIRP